MKNEEFLKLVDEKILVVKNEIRSDLLNIQTSIMESVNKSMMDSRQYFTKVYSDVRDERQLTKDLVEKKAKQIAKETIHEIVNGKFDHINRKLDDLKKSTQLSILGLIKSRFETDPRKTMLLITLSVIVFTIIILNMLNLVDGGLIFKNLRNMKFW